MRSVLHAFRPASCLSAPSYDCSDVKKATTKLSCVFFLSTSFQNYFFGLARQFVAPAQRSGQAGGTAVGYSTCFQLRDQDGRRHGYLVNQRSRSESLCLSMSTCAKNAGPRSRNSCAGRIPPRQRARPVVQNGSRNSFQASVQRFPPEKPNHAVWEVALPAPARAAVARWKGIESCKVPK
jgi:hypothetical protein